MQVHLQQVTVTSNDLDELNHVNNVRYLDWVQDIAKEHWQLASQKKWEDEIVWVVRKHEIVYYGAALLEDVLQIRTYIKENKGPISTRIVTFTNNKTGELLVTSSTDWCLLDKKTLRPKRIPNDIAELFD